MRSGLFRQVLFWLHLISGIVASIVIFIMSATGVPLAFESNVLRSVERSERTLSSKPEGQAPLPLEEVVARVRAEYPEVKFNSVSVFPEEDSAVFVGAGRRGGYWANPFTGESWQAGTSAWNGLFHWLRDWHRWLGMEGDGRAIGKALTGACNTAFLLLALTGLVLWWPKRWTKPVLRSIGWFRGGLKGKARDFNWHNVIGFWTLPVMIVLIVSGMVISYGWASNLVYRVVGEEPPVRGGPPGATGGPAVTVPTPPAGAKPLSYADVLAMAGAAAPGWERLTLQLGGGGARAEGARAEGAGGGDDARAEGAREEGARGEAAGSAEGARNGRSRSLRALTVSVRAAGKTPVNANSTLSLDPFTGAVLKAEGPADASTGRRLRSWLRYLHTGEALGLFGQIVAAIASLGGAVLVWTGLSLSWRRFFRRKGPKATRPKLGESGASSIPELANAESADASAPSTSTTPA